jgi:hypothetical protein
MVKESSTRDVHRCECRDCREHPHGRVAAEHRALNRLLAVSDERMRRLLAGFLAEQIGRGGVSHLSRITGLGRNTIARGRRELHELDGFTASDAGSPGTRVRRPGGGRKRVEAEHPGS